MCTKYHPWCMDIRMYHTCALMVNPCTTNNYIILIIIIMLSSDYLDSIECSTEMNPRLSISFSKNSK